MKTRIKEFRKSKNFTQKQMSDLLNISRQSYVYYENDTYEPSLQVLLKISEILETSIDELLGNDKYISQNQKKLEAINKIING